ncbi:hypothetical protein GCM10027092_17760 [Yaniella soli]
MQTGCALGAIVFEDSTFFRGIKVSIGIDIRSVFNKVLSEWHRDIAFSGSASGIEWHESLFHTKKSRTDGGEAWFCSLIVQVNIFDSSNFFVVLVIDRGTVNGL